MKQETPTGPAMPVFEPTWRLPPTGRVARRRPFLVNYHHRSLAENQVPQKEERLAQWDVLILHPADVLNEQLSLEKIRQTNPRIVILAWTPLQGPGDPVMKSRIPPEGPGDWFARQADGSYLLPHWKGHLMNPVVQDYAWPRLVLDQISHEYLRPKLYDGILFDCLWEQPPPGLDVVGDGQTGTPRGNELWQQALGFLLENTRRNFPHAILTGNSGLTWSAGCRYFAWANGNLRENALGTQFGVPEWQDVWEGAGVCLNAVVNQPAYHFIAVDVRHERTQPAAKELTTLSAADLRRLRLGLGLTLLRDGQYFGFDRGDCLHGQLWWFKEYDADLGNALEPYKTGVFGAGTLSRAFENGLVIVNTGENQIRITVDPPMKDATTDAVGIAFDIPQQDARILLHCR